MKRIFFFFTYPLHFFFLSNQKPTGLNLSKIIKQTLKIPFQLNDKQQIITQVCIGAPQQCFPFKIVTNMDACFVYSNQLAPNRGYNPDKSNSAGAKEKDIEFEYGLNKYKGYVIRDIMTLAQLDMTNFPFYVVTEGEASDW